LGPKIGHLRDAPKSWRRLRSTCPQSPGFWRSSRKEWAMRALAQTAQTAQTVTRHSRGDFCRISGEPFFWRLQNVMITVYFWCCWDVQLKGFCNSWIGRYSWAVIKYPYIYTVYMVMERKRERDICIYIYAVYSIEGNIIIHELGLRILQSCFMEFQPRILTLFPFWILVVKGCFKRNHTFSTPEIGSCCYLMMILRCLKWFIFDHSPTPAKVS
jgi:hypothetical protein